jgi:hypothetical protein
VIGVTGAGAGEGSGSALKQPVAATAQMSAVAVR